MKQLVIMGWPLSHSLSPIMHNAALSAMNLDKDFHYRSLQVKPTELRGVVDSITQDIIAGANVTIPYKSEIMNYLSSVDEDSAEIGAVNTIINKDGLAIGFNTDLFGFIQSLRQHKVRLHGLHASILGAGGAAKAVTYALAKEGVESVDIYSRTQQTGRILVNMVSTKFDTRIRLCDFPTKRSSSIDSDLLINCTPVGMHGHSTAKTPVHSSFLTKSLIVMDLVYNPLKTQLLTEAEQIGCRTISGLEMLVFQGAASLKLWTGIEPPTNVMREAVLDSLGGMPNE